MQTYTGSIDQRFGHLTADLPARINELTGAQSTSEQLLQRITTLEARVQDLAQAQDEQHVREAVA